LRFGGEDILGRLDELVIGLFERIEVEIEAIVLAAVITVLERAILVVVFVDVVAVIGMTSVSGLNVGDELVLFAAAIAAEIAVELDTIMRLIVESPRTGGGSAALAIPSNPESTISSLAKTKSEMQFGFRDLCNAADLFIVGVV
jgi:hypothetical protein